MLDWRWLRWSRNLRFIYNGKSKCLYLAGIRIAIRGGLIHDWQQTVTFSCPFSTTKSTAVVKKGAAMDTFTERTDLPGVLFLAGEPSAWFAWFVTSCYFFSNLKPLKSITRSSLLDFHSLSLFLFLFLSPHCTNYHSENWLRSLYLFLTGNSLPGLAGTGNSLHGW